MTLQPKISIITPSFNQGVYLEETILSVINQNYPNLEYIIIDGGSTDNSVDIIKKYTSNIHYWISEKDKGQSDAINKGLEKASGDIITWLNSDDVYLPQTLQIVASHFISNKNLGLVHGKTIVFGDTLKERVSGLNNPIPQHLYLAAMKFPQPSSFISREAFNVIGLVNIDLHYSMDFEWVSKLILKGFRILMIEDTLSKYRMHALSKSNHDLKFLKEWALVLYQTFSSLPNADFFAKEMIQLSLLDIPSTQTYDCSITLNHDQLSDIFYEHLHLHYHFNYRCGQFIESKKISEYIKANNPQYYHKMHFYRYDLRMKFIPRFIFKLLKNT